MTLFTSEQIQKAFDDMPAELVTAMNAVDVGKQVEIISKKYNLHIDTAGFVDGIITMVIIGLITAENLAKEVESIPEIPKGISEDIARDANSMIFVPIREKMKGYQESAKIESEPLEEPAPTTLTPETPTPAPSPEMRNIFSKSGIDLESMAEQKKVDAPLADLNVNRNELLESVENPIPTPMKTLSEEKLTQTASIPTSKIDLSLPNISNTPPTPPKRQVDPYREEPI
ncbi:MAG: hypothetical protein WC795_02145 [Candidatus Paceibacterota bacterium]|jgi:hypothetical protein